MSSPSWEALLESWNVILFVRNALDCYVGHGLLIVSDGRSSSDSAALVTTGLGTVGRGQKVSSTSPITDLGIMGMLLVNFLGIPHA